MRIAIVTLAVVLGLIGVTAVVFVWGFRTRSPRFLSAVRRLNRRVLNPRQLRTAGRPGSHASVVHHVGRRSGSPYRTPVVAVPDGDDAFVVVLPYGPDTDWVRNVVAAGEATLEHEGERIAVTDPDVVAEAGIRDRFPSAEQRAHRRFGIDQALRLVRAEVTASGDHASETTVL